MRNLNKVYFCIFLMVGTSYGLFADAYLSNRDSNRYDYMANTSESCFAGGVTSFITGNTTTSVQDGWFCLNKQKPAVKLEKGKKYKIQGGRVVQD